jgi:hypothetical protein
MPRIQLPNGMEMGAVDPTTQVATNACDIRQTEDRTLVNIDVLHCRTHCYVGRQAA